MIFAKDKWRSLCKGKISGRNSRGLPNNLKTRSSAIALPINWSEMLYPWNRLWTFMNHVFSRIMIQLFCCPFAGFHHKNTSSGISSKKLIFLEQHFPWTTWSNDNLTANMALSIAPWFLKRQVSQKPHPLNYKHRQTDVKCNETSFIQ